MAKDGSKRGGRRPGAGRKPKPLADKINEGKVAEIIDFKTGNLKGRKMPEVDDYMKAEQKAGIKLEAEKIYQNTYKWLKERGCDELINPILLHEYAMSAARWVQCQIAINKFGFLSKHPTTGNAIASPFVSMLSSFQKAMDASWYQIYQVVRDNCSVAYTGNPNDDLMTQLLNS